MDGVSSVTETTAPNTLSMLPNTAASSPVQAPAQTPVAAAIASPAIAAATDIPDKAPGAQVAAAINMTAAAQQARPANNPGAEQSEVQRNLEAAQAAIQRGGFAEALAMLRPLSQSGNAVAQLLLADLYASGKGLATDCNAAYMWYGVAARRGNADAAARKTQLASRCRLQEAEIKNNERLIQEWRPRQRAGSAAQ